MPIYLTQNLLFWGWRDVEGHQYGNNKGFSCCIFEKIQKPARIYILQNNIPVNYSIPHSLKKSTQFELCTHVQNNTEITNRITFLIPTAKYAKQNHSLQQLS